MKVLTKEYLGYTFLSSGKVFKNGKEVTYYKSYGREKSYVRVRLNGKRYYLATLICKLFNGVSENRNLIFKDRNHLNLDYRNLMFLDDANYRTYSKWQPKDPSHRKIKPICHFKAYLKATDPDLKQFYLTQDISFVYKSWNRFKPFLKNKKYKDEVFDYFLDRCLRNSILGNPQGLMQLYEKTFWGKEDKKFNDNIKYRYYENAS
jgi:hypothetical protein